MSTRPEAEARLDRLLSTMQPALDPQDYVYAVISAASRGLSVPFCRVREAEGDTVILSRAEAERNGLDCKFLCRRIALLVHSSLEAVGLLAVVSAELAQHGISANCVSGYFHDHLFVPATQGDRALAVLQALQRRVSGSSTPRGASTSNLLENVVIREMTLGDYDAVRGLLASVPGVTLRSADSREGTQLYLERNAGLSFVALLGSRIVGCVMCGHDGRRGYLQHLAVEADLRSRGIGGALAERSLAALERLGIEKTHIDVLADNIEAQQFWVNRGWRRRSDLLRYSLNRSSDPNA